MEFVRHPYPGAAGQLDDRVEDFGQGGPWDNPVLDDVVGADASDRGEGRLASLPDQRAVGGVGGQPLLEGAVLGAQPLDVGILLVVIDLDRGAVELDDGGDDAGGDDRGRGGTCLVGGLETHQDRPDLFGEPYQPDRHRGDDAERALRADDGAEQVRSRERPGPSRPAAPCRRQR